MLNRIHDTDVPAIFHLFWAGNKMPDYAIYNLFSFISNLPRDGQVQLWVTNPDCLYLSPLFKRLGLDKFIFQLMLPMIQPKRASMKLDQNLL